MAQVRRLIVTLTLAATLVTAAGCGGGGNGDAVEVGLYASSVCNALTTWREQLTSASTILAQRTSTTEDLRDVRRQFVAFYDGAVDVTDEMLAAVAEAGVPDVDNGEEVAAGLQKELRRFRPILVRARNSARKLPVDDEPAFAIQAQRLGTQFLIEANALATMFQALDEQFGAPELRRAADEDAACRAL
jgi:hypothetical protein